ncbi:MAG: pilus assembly protein [Propionibacteriaceae bacterium]|jgi:Flp pilus assembly protein TadG|nr:pilus assembly protein [Propionibacteriaceae bacterium]
MAIPHPRPRRTCRIRSSGSSTIETLICLPVMLMLVFGIVQTGIWFFARSVCQSAALDAAQVASAWGGDEAAARIAAEAFLERTGGVVRHATIAVSLDDERAVVTITGASPTIVPLFPTAVHHSVSLPVER